MQADSYLGRLREVMATVAEDPRRGLPCDDVSAGYRRISAGSHVIFFRMRGSDVYVVRVLHQRMDFRRHL
jgi:toxin ParE1/3/4